jgi:hypothetical protein
MRDSDVTTGEKTARLSRKSRLARKKAGLERARLKVLAT